MEVFEDDFPFQRGDFQVPAISFWGSKPPNLQSVDDYHQPHKPTAKTTRGFPSFKEPNLPNKKPPHLPRHCPYAYAFGKDGRNLDLA